MARKKTSQQQKKDVASSASVLPNKNKRPNGSDANFTNEEDLIEKRSTVTAPEAINDEHFVEAEIRSNHKTRKSPKREKQVMDATVAGGQTVSDTDNSEKNTSTSEPSQSTERDHTSSNIPLKSNFADSFNESLIINDTIENAEFFARLVFTFLRSIALSLYKVTSQWLERLEPMFASTKSIASNALDHVRVKIEHVYPIIAKWSMYIGKIMFLVMMVWLECTLRGLDSFLHLGTTSFFTVIWCSVLSIVAMIGVFKFLMAMAIIAVVGLFVGFSLGILLIVISGITLTYFYGSFWITLLVVLSGGSAFLLKRDRLALFIATSYSMYCAWGYVGWLGLFCGLNLSFISSEALIFLLRDNINEQRRAPGSTEQTAGFFPNEQAHASSSEAGGAGVPNHRGPGFPSTSGSDTETSEDEVLRLLNCNDHYTALGLSRFQDVDVSALKREYRKKAMLVHPDKNMSNPKAAEAFQKLQNAYEVLLDSYKRKSYDDELRREELLNYFSRFQETSRMNGRNGFFTSGMGREHADDEETLAESRRIACKKCGNFHIWLYTKKMKSKARWCQECKDYHPAKDGDGWVEQLSHPVAFGLLQKTDPPAAYICANSKIYNATEWYMCQGMRCAANTHKPSFHVNTNVTWKQGNGKGGGNPTGQKTGGGTGPPNLDETMTEEEFFEWLQNAVQTGMFDNMSANHPDAANPFAGTTGSTSKSSGGSSSSSSSNPKRKKKAKR